jgi:hypothetical protein
MGEFDWLFCRRRPQYLACLAYCLQHNLLVLTNFHLLSPVYSYQD